MYEGLVKSLRYCATHDCRGEGEREAGCTAPYSLRKDCDTCNQVLQADAADAIEELSKRSECPCWYGGIRFCAMLGKPIPEPQKEEK